VNHEDVLVKIEATEREIARLRTRRDPEKLRPLLRAAQAEAEILEKRLALHLPNDQPPPRWVPLALLGLPVGLVSWLWLLSRFVK
jgi:hypothetical protein